MPLCGFNQKMLEGLTAFHEGLVEHGLTERSKIRGQSEDETLQRELEDMNRFLAETPNLNPEIKEIVEGLTNYARAFYELVQRNGVDKSVNVIKALTTLYFEMDRQYYSELEGTPDDMGRLVDYLNNFKF